ncbi:MAG: WD40/YVTN/BNR-like repeat-containing protein, partial [bacterium]
GATWQVRRVQGADSLDFRAVQAVDEKTAYLMSAGPGERSRIYKTSDGGETWELQFTNDFPDGFLDGIAFWNKEIGVAYGDPVDRHLFIIKTRNGGSTWDRIPPENIPPAMEGEYGFAASGTGVVVVGEAHAWIGTGGTVARVFRSMDQGETWSVASTPIASGQAAGIFSLAFQDSENGVVVGGDYQKDDLANRNIALTKDGGKTWALIKAPHNVGFRSCVSYSSAKSILVTVGTSGSDYSTDFGRTWSRIDTSSYHTVTFSESGQVGWAAGASGRIAKLVID